MNECDSNKDCGGKGKRLSRREIIHLAMITGVPLVLGSMTGCSSLLTNVSYAANPDPFRDTAGKGPGPMPEPVINPRSTEICLNSRISYHGGWSGTASDKWLSNVLHACRRAPVTSGPVTIYAATPENLYVYDPQAHALDIHLTGNRRGDSSSAFQLGFASTSVFDACVAQHLSQVATVALWDGTTSQLGSCPRNSDTSYANSNWSPIETVQTAITFGIRSVAGFKTDLQAISSDQSLPDPSTDGSIYFDNAVQSFKYSTLFKSAPLDLQQLSQLLWSIYGCTAHTASGGKAALTVASAVANYYLTRRIYMVSQMGVHRYHMRTPPGDSLYTKDHRIETVTDTDVRESLQQSISGLPIAPVYFVLCLDPSQVTTNWALVDVGYAAGSALVQATSMGLNTYFRTDFTTGERTTIQTLTGIPSTDAPIAIVMCGQRNVLADLTKSSDVTPIAAEPSRRRP